MFKERTRLVLSLLCLLFLADHVSAVEYRTLNFLVDAPSVEVGRQIGAAAERYRKELAEKWLGKEMPTWDEPCPLRVTVTGTGSGGATSFAFDNGEILSQRMHIQGTLDRLLVSVLPHEVTHTILAHHFRSPVPRWADEGGAVLCEDKLERRRHDQLIRRIVKDGRMIPLSRLFALRDYPTDVMVLYCEGYSVTHFLVEKRNRKTFLAFVKQGTEDDWDRALKDHYGYKKVEDLEKEWLAHLRRTAPEKSETRTSLSSRPARPVLCALRERP